MRTILTRRLLDLGGVAALLTLLAIPLIVLRGDPAPLLDRMPGWIAAVLGVLTLWAILRRRFPEAASPPGALVTGNDADQWSRWQTALVAVLLAGLTLVSYYVPLTYHFWGGADDFICFLDIPYQLWMESADLGLSRPLLVVPIALARALTPDRVEGFLWLATLLGWANGLLLFANLRILLPRARLLPVAAAILLTVDRAEPSRFYVLWTTIFYWMPLTLLLLAVWLFLWSYRRGSRPLLLLSCLALVATLLTHEGTFPLAALAPLLAWCLPGGEKGTGPLNAKGPVPFSPPEHRKRLVVWACAWTGTVAVLAIRFALYLSAKGAGSYQGEVASEVLRNPARLGSNLLLHLAPGLRNFHTTTAATSHWKTFGVVLVFVLALAGVIAWRAGSGVPRRRHYLIVMGMAVLVLLAGVIAFLPMPYVFRTQFFAGPGQAVLLAAALCLAGSLLGRRAGGVAVMAMVGLLAANATAESVAEQRRQQAESPLNFDRVVQLFRQVHTVCPSPPPDALILLFYDDPSQMPFTGTYCCGLMSKRLLGASMLPANVADHTPIPVVPVYHQDGITLENGDRLSLTHLVGYDRVIAFRVAVDDSVTLLRRLPIKGLPADQAEKRGRDPLHSEVPSPFLRLAARYDPLALLRPGPVAELDYLRFPYWSPQAPDLFDMREGVLLGRGWGPPEGHEGRVVRRVTRRGELVINSLGEQVRHLQLDVEAAQAGRLEVLDAQDNVLAAADVNGRGVVRLAVPTDPARVNLLSLRFSGFPKGDRTSECKGPVPFLKLGTTSGPQDFLVYCPVGQTPRSRPPTCRPQDVLLSSLSVGDNWYPLEKYEGDTFRWVHNDAEVILEAPTGRTDELVLLMEPGPCLEGRPCRLTLLDEAGRGVAATEAVRGRESVRLPLPPGVPAGSVFRLHVDGGSKPVSEREPRILNFRVFRCAWGERDH